MSEPAPPQMSLRARQKVRTRDNIREAAMRLFSERGYTHTTVEQIAAQAEVSHTTFFRYFQTKEQVVIADDLEGAVAAILVAIPPGLGRFDLLRGVIAGMYEVSVADPWASSSERARLIQGEPALAQAHAAQKERTIAEATDNFADYLGVDPGDFGLGVFMAAIGGVVFRLVDAGEPGFDGQDLDQVLRAIDLLEAGLPVGS